MQQILILGAGPTGLSCGFSLKNQGCNRFKIYEQADHPGGLASSYTTSQGFTFDFGGHVLFSADPYFHKLLDELLEKQYLTHNRKAFIYFKNRLVPYPFQNNLHYLPPEIAYECLAGIYQANQAQINSKAAPKNFRDWLLKTFGAGLCQHFLFPYNSKIWTNPLWQMNYNWIAERVSVPEFLQLLKTFVMQKKDSGWGPNAQFKYALKGTGELFNLMAKSLGKNKVFYRKNAVKIDPQKKVVHFADGEKTDYRQLVSTIPLSRLLKITSGLPKEFSELAARFLYSSVYCLGLGIKGKCPSDKHWLYFPEKKFPFYRVTYLSNFSPYLTPGKDYFSLLCEAAYSEHSPLKASPESMLKGIINAGLLSPYTEKDIVEVWERTEEYAYCVPFKERDLLLEQILPELEKLEIYSCGRFGLWKYEIGNTDHSILQGKALAEKLCSKKT